MDLLTIDPCTLPTADRSLRQAEFDDLFRDAVDRVSIGSSVRLHLVGSDRLRERVADLTARETSCCSFFTFDLTDGDRGLVLDIAVPPAYSAILTALGERARELSA